MRYGACGMRLCKQRMRGALGPIETKNKDTAMGRSRHDQPSTLRMAVSPHANPSTPAAQAWGGLDPLALEHGQRGGRGAWQYGLAVSSFVVLGLLAVVWMAQAPTPARHASAGMSEEALRTLRGAPIDPGSSATSAASVSNADNGAQPETRHREPAGMLDGRWHIVDFDLLASFDVPDPWSVGSAQQTSRTEIPAYIQALDGLPVAIVGFASTHQTSSQGLSREFALFRTQAMCCFGVPPLPHEVILCRVQDARGLDLIDGIPMRIKGTLRVVPEYLDGVVLLGVYYLDAAEASVVQWK